MNVFIENEDVAYEPHFIAKNMTRKLPKSTSLTENVNFGKLQAMFLSFM